MATQLKNFSKFIAATGVFGLASLCSVSTASAVSVNRVTAATFGAEAGRITFSEPGFALGTVNPVYAPAQYGAGVNAPIVSFGALFAGQTNTNAAVAGTPTAGLALTGIAKIVRDDANPSTPVLGGGQGSSLFRTPISILFNRNVSAVGLDAGFFDTIGSTQITAFDRNGANLGSVVNAALGIEFLGLVTDDGSNQIAGLQFSALSADASGFAIDNVRFNAAVNTPIAEAVPEPFTIVGTLIGGTAALRMRKKLKSND
jgi:hypothetical protein